MAISQQDLEASINNLRNYPSVTDIQDLFDNTVFDDWLIDPFLILEISSLCINLDEPLILWEWLRPWYNSSENLEIYDPVLGYSKLSTLDLIISICWAGACLCIGDIKSCRKIADDLKETDSSILNLYTGKLLRDLWLMSASPNDLELLNTFLRNIKKDNIFSELNSFILLMNSIITGTCPPFEYINSQPEPEITDIHLRAIIDPVSSLNQYQNWTLKNSLFPAKLRKERQLLREIIRVFPGCVAITNAIPAGNTLVFASTTGQHLSEDTLTTIKNLLDKKKPIVAFSTVFSQLEHSFQQLIDKSSIQVTAVLPCSKEIFIKHQSKKNTDFATDLTSLLRNHHNVVSSMAGDDLSNPTLLDYTYQYTTGLALMKTIRLGGNLTLFLIHSESETEQSLVRTIRESWDAVKKSLPDNRCEIITHQINTDPVENTSIRTNSKSHQILASMVFADASGFSKLTEDQIPVFMNIFLGNISDILNDFPSPLWINTWGDSIYIVFDNVGSAGDFALKLQSSVEKTTWSKWGLPDRLQLRVGIHCGPVHRLINPVTGMVNYTGAHVIHTARLEPVTPPGKVYVTEGFAAICAALGIHNFNFRYTGKVRYAKDFGTYPVYLLNSQ
ncbi:MAG: adenylate/guanylate cyclase domain-containing protein [Deltaproteobacteria bacterium]|nr:adenylate/guanylate cyclase domain-containing protein [Deltaproteobacteria bacterium]